MAPTFTLAAVLSLREQRENAEERALAAIAAQVGQVRSVLERLDHEMVQLQARRVEDMQTTRIGAEHEASFARSRILREARTELQVQLQELERRRLQQQTRYLAARADREMITELRQQQRTAWDTQFERREQRRIDDLFTTRRARE